VNKGLAAMELLNAFLGMLAGKGAINQWIFLRG
jgi:hypothetical protein